MSSPTSELSFRDRFFTPEVYRAMTSPGASLGAGAAAAVAIVAGLPFVAAGAAAAAAWGARVLLAVPSNPKRPSIDLAGLAGPWRAAVERAVAAQTRFEQVVTRAEPGPVADRLGAMRARIDDCVRQSYALAERGQAIAVARTGIDTGRLDHDIAALSAAGEPPDGSSQDQALTALRSQRAAAQRLDETIATVTGQLTVLDARLDELVARALELSVASPSDPRLASLDDELVGVVDELEALRQAIEETG
ncbi:MAG: hypothetical protein ACK5PP_02475 [Acidimicrobiales bacterium]